MTGPLHPRLHFQEFDAVAIRARLEAAMGDNAAALDTRDDGFIELVLKMLGLMCDGQNDTLQVSNSQKGTFLLFFK